MFRPPVVALFREMLFEGYITYNVKSSLQVCNVAFYVNGLKSAVRIYGADKIIIICVELPVIVPCKVTPD